jgi:acyl-CoA thioesterase-1
MSSPDCNRPLIAPIAGRFRLLARRARRAALAAVALSVLAGPIATSQAAAANDAPTLLVLGDSLSAGYGLSPGQGWVDLLQRKLAAQGYRHKVVNASISGDTTAGGRSRIGPALAAHHPRVVIVELGANDGLRGTTLETVRANLDYIVATAQRAGAQVLVAGMRLPPNYGPVYVSQFAALFAEVATARKVALVPFLMEGFADRPELFQPDRIHPTAQAQPLMVENVWPTLVRLLKR